MPQCTICTHPRRAAIDHDLVAGKSLRSVALRFGVSHLAAFRHKRDHIPADLARAAEATDLARSLALEAQVQAQQASADARRVDVLAELRGAFDRVTKLFDACDRWLSDPDHPDRYDVGPRAAELLVHYTTRDGLGRRVRAKAPLSTLLARLEPGEGDLAVDLVEVRHADPRDLLLKAARRLEAELQLVARLIGQLEQPAQATVNVLIASPEWLATRAALLAALDRFPEARAAVSEALQHAAADR